MESSYFGMYHGFEANYSELGATKAAVDALLQEPPESKTRVLGQGLLELPGVIPGDKIVWMPEKVKERQIREQELIDNYTAKIKKGVVLFDGTKRK